MFKSRDGSENHNLQTTRSIAASVLTCRVIKVRLSQLSAANKPVSFVLFITTLLINALPCVLGGVM